MGPKSYPVLIALMLISLMCNAQSNKTISISVTPRSITTFDMSVINEAGMHTEKIVDKNQWLNYAIESNNQAYAVSASLSSGIIPPGMEIDIEGDYNNGRMSKGNKGYTVGPIVLGNIPTVMLRDIYSSVTGVGSGCGANIVITIKITDFALLHTGSYPLTICYTIAQQ